MIKPYYETELGKLYHGDCLTIIPDLEQVDLVVTDPPYNAKKDYGKFKDDLPGPEYEKWMTNCFNLSSKIAENQAWIAPRYKMNFFTSLMPKAHMIVVRRGARGPFRQGWSDQFETILTIGTPNKCDVDLWDDIRLKGEGYYFRENTFGHPGYTPQPIMFRLVYLLSKESVCDIFMGTGTTAIACERLGRKWIGIEISEEYCELSANRIEAEASQLKLFR